MSEVKTILKNFRLLPTEGQELLLKACLQPKTEAIVAWEQWRNLENLDFLDHSSNRLLPLLFHNLEKHGMTDAVMDRYKGTFRKNWYKNHLLFAELKELVQLLQNEGIETMVLKGSALLLSKTYPNYGLRPMADLDVLVPARQIAQAIEILDKNNWNCILRQSYIDKEPALFKRKKIGADYFSICASGGFRNAAMKEFDLHSHAFVISANSPQLDADFWTRSKAYPLTNELSVQILSPTDTLLHSVSHGLRRGTQINLRWIADAFYLIQSHSIDWELLISNSKRLGLTPFVKYGLLYLKELLNVEIPSDVLQRLKAMPTSKKEMIHFESENYPVRKLSNLSLLWNQHARINSKKSALHQLVLFPKHLQGVYFLEHVWQVPLLIIYKLLRVKKKD
jgi:hypothetical protein